MSGWPTKVFPPMAAALFVASCGSNRPHHAEAAASVRTPVQTVIASVQNWPAVYQATGTVRARTSAVISSRVNAYVQQVSVQAGDHVSAGQTLITLDSRDMDANYRRSEAGRTEVESAIPEADSGVAGAKASLDLALITFRRMEELYAKKSISNQEYDEATSRLKGARAAYDMARARRIQLNARLDAAEQESRAAAITRDYTRITAPFAGVVTAKSVEPGNLATMGAPLLTIERSGTYRLEASVEESRMGSVRLGQAVRVSLDAPGCDEDARVSEIVPAVDASSRSYLVRIDLAHPCPLLRSGMFGRAAFPLDSRRVLAVPANAILERGQIQSIFVAESSVVRTRLITTGERSGDAVEVLSGLNAGEVVVSPVPAGLTDGSTVEVRP